MRAIGYVRVSTERQAEQGVSLEAQEAKIRAMATVQGAELLEAIIDGGQSAKTLNRPGLQKLLALVNKGEVQAIIIAKLDRLTRSVKDLCGRAFSSEPPPHLAFEISRQTRPPRAKLLKYFRRLTAGELRIRQLTRQAT